MNMQMTEWVAAVVKMQMAAAVKPPLTLDVTRRRSTAAAFHGAHRHEVTLLFARSC